MFTFRLESDTSDDFESLRLNYRVDLDCLGVRSKSAFWLHLISSDFRCSFRLEFRALAEPERSDKLLGESPFAELKSSQLEVAELRAFLLSLSRLGPTDILPLCLLGLASSAEKSGTMSYPCSLLQVFESRAAFYFRRPRVCSFSRLMKPNLSSITTEARVLIF